MAEPTRSGGRTATVEDLYKVEGKAEIVDGEVVVMSPTGFLPGRAGHAICSSLKEYERKTGRGYAIPDNVAFIVNLARRRSFSPDAAFYVGPPTGAKFISGAPVFAAEVRSEGDYGPAAERRMAAKRADYFAAGTAIVWDVDVLREELVRVYGSDSPSEPRIYGRGQAAEGEPALPGWSMAIDELFA
jgi:Uma2 family endonuclease